MRDIKRNDKRLITYNGVNFDYPVIHFILTKAIKAKKESKKLSVTAGQLFKYAQKVIDSKKDGGFGIYIKPEEILLKQCDLMKINHFDNKAKMTSLKLLEFNMRSHNVEDLPYQVGSKLTSEEIDVLIEYNKHDVMQTLEFYKRCLDMIKMREDLSVKYGFDCINYSDTKIGEQFFMKKIEKEQPEAFYEIGIDGKRKMKQTKRDFIDVGKCLFSYLQFSTPEFKALHKWFSRQKITETKGVFSDIEEHQLGDLAKYSEMVVKKVKFPTKPNEEDVTEFKKQHPLGWVEEIELKATQVIKDEQGNPVKEEYVCEKTGKIKLRNKKEFKKSYYGCFNVAETLNIVYGGCRIDYGVGGLHGALQGTIHSNDEYELLTYDVASMYPNIAIANRVYPEHLGESFCDSYEDFYQERKKFAKGTGENLAIKLGLNSVYGKSNDKFSAFYDPMYTMKITINGQLSLSMLAEKLVQKCDARLIMLNTDGVEVYVKRDKREEVERIISLWEKVTGLEMEGDVYKAMYIRDVNNYTSITTHGKVKQKGAYEYKDLAWHKNMSALVVPMAVEHELFDRGSAEDFIRTHKNEFDFMLRAKVPRSSRLVTVDENGKEELQQNVCRYYPSVNGKKLVKLMPNEDSEDGWKRLGIDTEWNVTVCNDMSEFEWDINYDYYIEQAKKLLEPLKETIY
ncbi:MAG: hypothetical protein KBT03_00360 [Bacteroidales bacterium]|nr:hypothetical protein [Candidatus Scybalousia scybalohippi]